MQEMTPAGKRSPRRTWLNALLLIGVIIALLYVIPRSFGAALEREDGFIPVPLHAGAPADYRAEALVSWRFSTNGALLESAIRDRDPSAMDAPDRAARIVQSFETPVPTVTSQSLWSLATAAITQFPIVQTTPTADASESTALDTSPTADSTATSGPLPTSTPSQNPTQIPTTQVPSNTPVPSSTPTAVSCKGVTITNYSVNGQQITWVMINNSTISVELTGLRLDWPVANEELVKVELGGDAIWDHGDDFPPTNISSGWKSGIGRSIGVGQVKTLTFQFEKSAASSGYELRVNFDISCVLFDNH